MSKSGKDSSSKKEQQQETESIEVENTGNYLRTLRLGKGLSIKDVAEATRISENNLKALEDMDFSALPANTFTRGLLNIYANFLGANAETVVTKFMEEREGSATQKRRSRQSHPRKILTPKRLAEPTQISSMTMAGFLLLFIVVSFTGYCVYTSWNPFSMLMKKNGDMQSVMKSVFPGEKNPPGPSSSEEIIIISAEQSPREPAIPTQPVRETEQPPAPLPGEATISPGAPVIAEEADSQDTKYTITISFLQDTAIELTRDDSETIVQEFKAGELQSWSAESSINMTFARPDSAEILVNNISVAFPETQDGKYTLHIPQDVAELLQDE